MRCNFFCSIFFFLFRFWRNRDPTISTIICIHSECCRNCGWEKTDTRCLLAIILWPKSREYSSLISHLNFLVNFPKKNARDFASNLQIRLFDSTRIECDFELLCRFNTDNNTKVWWLHSMNTVRRWGSKLIYRKLDKSESQMGLTISTIKVFGPLKWWRYPSTFRSGQPNLSNTTLPLSNRFRLVKNRSSQIFSKINDKLLSMGRISWNVTALCQKSRNENGQAPPHFPPTVEGQISWASLLFASIRLINFLFIWFDDSIMNYLWDAFL